MDNFAATIIELMDEIIETYNLGVPMNVSQFQQFLEDAGYWVTPIDDPTNFFGIQEDSV